MQPSEQIHMQLSEPNNLVRKWLRVLRFEPVCRPQVAFRFKPGFLTGVSHRGFKLSFIHLAAWQGGRMNPARQALMLGGAASGNLELARWLAPHHAHYSACIYVHAIQIVSAAPEKLASHRSICLQVRLLLKCTNSTSNLRVGVRAMPRTWNPYF